MGCYIFWLDHILGSKIHTLSTFCKINRSARWAMTWIPPKSGSSYSDMFSICKIIIRAWIQIQTTVQISHFNPNKIRIIDAYMFYLNAQSNHIEFSKEKRCIYLYLTYSNVCSQFNKSFLKLQLYTHIFFKKRCDINILKDTN